MASSESHIALPSDLKKETSQKAQHLLQVVTQEVEEKQLRNDIIDLIESIMVYKFPQMSRKEIAAMLGVDDLKQTRFYQEVFTEGKQEGKLEVVSRMLESGVELDTIAQWLDLPLEMVKKEANKKQNNNLNPIASGKWRSHIALSLSSQTPIAVGK